MNSINSTAAHFVTSMEGEEFSVHWMARGVWAEIRGESGLTFKKVSKKLYSILSYWRDCGHVVNGSRRGMWKATERFGEIYE